MDDIDSFYCGAKAARPLAPRTTRSHRYNYKKISCPLEPWAIELISRAEAGEEIIGCVPREGKDFQREISVWFQLAEVCWLRRVAHTYSVALSRLVASVGLGLVHLSDVWRKEPPPPADGLGRCESKVRASVDAQSFAILLRKANHAQSPLGPYLRATVLGRSPVPRLRGEGLPILLLVQ